MHCWVKLLPYLQNDYDESHTTSRISSAGENGKISVTPPRQKSLQIMVQTSFYCVLIRYNWGPTLLISHAEIYKVSEFYDSTKYTVVFTPSLYMLTVKWPPCWLTTIFQIVTWFRRIVVRVCAEALCTLQSNCASLGDYCVCVNARCLLGKFPKELIKVTDFGHVHAKRIMRVCSMHALFVNNTSNSVSHFLIASPCSETIELLRFC